MLVTPRLPTRYPSLPTLPPIHSTIALIALVKPFLLSPLLHPTWNISYYSRYHPRHHPLYHHIPPCTNWTTAYTTNDITPCGSTHTTPLYHLWFHHPVNHRLFCLAYHPPNVLLIPPLEPPLKPPHYGTKPGHFETSKSRFPTSEWAQRRARAKRAVRSKRTSERCERTSERTSEWPSTSGCILGCSGPQCVDFMTFPSGWRDVPGSGSATLRPLHPQSGSSLHRQLLFLILFLCEKNARRRWETHLVFWHELKQR